MIPCVYRPWTVMVYQWCHMSGMVSQINGNSTFCWTTFRTDNKPNIKAPHHWTFVMPIKQWSVDSPHKKQLCGKIFHVLTLACNIGVIVMGSPSHSLEWGAQLINNDYRKLSDTRRTKSQNWNVSRLSLQLSLCNILKPSVKWRMKM